MKEEDKLIETARALMVALTDNLNKLKYDYDVDMYQEAFDYMNKKKDVEPKE